MRAVVVGAGLGGLGVALRLQGQGHEVVVLEQRERPGGRASQLRDAGFTWDTGPSLMTMPWVLEETFAAGGLDLHAEVDLRPARPASTGSTGPARSDHLDFVRRAASAMRAQIARFSAARRGRVDGVPGRAAPDLRGRHPRRRAPAVPARARPRPPSRPGWSAWGAALPLHALVARHFRHPRVREAFSFHSLFIGGDPFRVPAIYAALVYLQVARRRLVRPTAACTRWSRRWPGRSTCAAASGWGAIEHTGGRVTGVVLAGGERIAADVVVSNADVLRRRELLGDAGRRARRLRPTMSCFLLYLGTDRRFEPAAAPHAARRSRLPRLHPRRHAPRAARRRRSRPTSTRPSRTEPAMARARRRLARGPAAGPEPPRRDRLGARGRPAARRAASADLEATFGLEGLRRRVVVEHRMTPLDFARELGAVDGNAFAVEPTLHQSRLVPPAQPRPPRCAGLYHVGGGTHPGAGMPGVLLGRRGHRAASWPDDRRAPPGARRTAPCCCRGLSRRPPRSWPRRGATTRRVGRTFALACRLLPRRRARRRLPASTSCSARSTTSSTTARPDAPAARRRRRGVVRRRVGRRSREARRARPTWPRRHDLPRHAAARLLPRDARRPRRAPGPDRGRRSTATATASPAPSGW